jgi:hypothetical protein
VATNFPASLDSLTNPTSSDSLNSPSHSAQHTNVNDAVEALQAKVGADSSAVTTSLDYKVAQLEAISHGKILQVVQGINTTEVTTTSAPPVATGLDVTITPSSTSSKVLLLVSCQGLRTRAGLSLYRGGVASGTQLESAVIARYIQGTNEDDGMCFNYLDSPNTTSATTYEVGLDAQATGSITYLNRNSANVSTIIALEVSA